jgi:hypothetical protein
MNADKFTEEINRLGARVLPGPPMFDSFFNLAFPQSLVII